MKTTHNPAVQLLFDNYPEEVRPTMNYLRDLVFQTASEIEEINSIEETLKWGEPSYLTKYGSTLRMDWKEKLPNQVALYFQCTSKLVPTFKTLFGNTFEYEGTRAVVLPLGKDLPEAQLKECIAMALMYHKRKHLPLLS